MYRMAFLALVFVGSGLPLSGCGDDPPPATTRRRAKKKKKKRTKGAAAGAIDQSRLPAKLRNIDWSKEVHGARPDRKTRDPFLPKVDDIVADIRTAQQEAESARPSRAQRRRVSAFNVEELQLIAIITGTAVHRAMVTDPSGLGHVIRTGDVVGRDTPYRVTRITRNEAIFKPLQPPTDENQPKEIRKALRSNDELEELQ